MPTRRQFLAAAGQLAAAAALGACGARLPGGLLGGRSGVRARLTARPGAVPTGSPAVPTGPGTHALGFGGERPPLLHVPPGTPADRPLPLVLALHGAGGDAEAGLGLFGPLADERGLLLLAPASRGRTWDAIRGDYGADAELVDRALRTVFAAVPVDADRIAVAGFSDGASYALGLGLANGDLFRRVVAFSPGFVPPGPRTGRPAVFVSHGEADDVLPIGETSRRIVPDLRDDGYDVTYRRFPGPHAVPPRIAREAVDWLG